jgi:Ala-tRNA(Pro) deacylase
MPEEVPKMVADVSRALRQRGPHFEIVQHARAVGAIQEAISLGLAADEVLKAVVLETSYGPALAVLPASRRLDMDLVRAATGDRHARIATEAEIEREIPDCELGAVPPLGSVVHTAVYVDPEVLRRSVVAFAAGSQTSSAKGPTAELFRGESVTITPIAEPAGGRIRDNG